MKKPNKQNPISWLLVLGLVFCAILNLAIKNWLIIRYGVRAFGLMQKIAVGVVAVGAIITIAKIAMLVRAEVVRQLQEQVLVRQKQKSQVLDHYAEGGPNPELIRGKLEQLQREMPAFLKLAERCLGQMDRMDSLQARQSRLIRANDAIYLKETEAVLDNVERRICRNLQNVINLCTVVDNPQQLDPQKAEKYLSENEDRLEDSQRLLDASVDWINQYNADHNSDRRELESWIATITEALKED